ncbi:hypothetical protein [Chishuiella sp.]|uniref:hypothetical protein n=1 Tax=Chishuiella sp. TaxID=1969467 RepID=UPI0028AB78C5|nr:hypothetical protein [Chishuiella sp.]
MIRKNIINNAEEFEILNNQIYVGNDTFLTIYDTHLKVLKKENIGVFFLKKFNNYILLQPKSDKERENVYVINENNKLLFGLILTHSFIENDQLYILNSNRNIIKYDNKINKITEYHNIGRFPKLFINNTYLKITIEQLFCYKLNNNGILWQQSFTDLLQSEEVLLRYYYVYKEKIVIHLLTNGLLQNKYVSIVLDVNTGKELYRTEETLGKKLINGLGYTLYDQILWISNPETYEVKRIDLSETLFPLNKIIDDKIGDVDLGKTEVKFRFSPDYFSVDYPYLYFSEQRGLQVGALNIETKELVFHTEIEEKGLVKDLKSSNGKLFVHTTENNLYVFG